MAAIHTHEGSRPGLSYEYLNEPKPIAAVETMHSHRGTVTLRLGPVPDHLEGDYYSGRDRANIGSIAITRMSRAFLSREQALSKFANHTAASLSP